MASADANPDRTRSDSRSRRASLSHLLRRLELVEARVRVAVASRRAGDPDPGDRFRGLYVSQAHVERLLAPTESPPPADAAAAQVLAQAEAEADSAEAKGFESRLRRLARSFQLDEVDVELLLIALAPDLDTRFERLYGYLQDDVTRRRASIGLVLELCGLGPAHADARRRLASGAALLEGRLVQVEETDRPFLTRALRVPDRVAAFLLGDDTPDPTVAALTFPCDPRAAMGDAGPLARWLGTGLRLSYVRERSGASGAALAAAAFARVGRPTLALDLRRLRPEDDPQLVAALASREGRLRGAGLLVRPIDVMVTRGVPAIRAFAEMPGPVVVVGSVTWDPAWSHDVPFITEALLPDAGQRAELWRTSLRGDTDADLDAAVAMAQFRLSPEQIQRTAAAARLHARTADRLVEASDLRAGARAQNAVGLERLARRIEPAVSFEDLVLPPDALAQLTELLTRARQRERVLDVWKMGGSASRRRGLTALFAGPSGTGKTMAAEVLARELGLDLYTVDLATVVDKYVGETEKNLDRIFTEAECVNGVLFFDEADALFGKRSEVRDAHDRYANVEIAYLLQRMELFEGIAILATNLRANLDEAFTRRLDVVVDFPEPEEQYRRLLWEGSLGPLVPRAKDLDLDFMARAFKLCGGSIRNIVIAAAYLAAPEDRPLRMTDLIRATQREYQKLGRLYTESEFGSYYQRLAEDGGPDQSGHRESAAKRSD